MKQQPNSERDRELEEISRDPRVTVRRDGVPDPDGRAVVYWMQRSERGIDNHAVDVAVRVANLLELPLVVYFAGISNFPHANLRHYVFLNQGLPDILEQLAERNISFVMRRAPHESHERLLADVRAAFLIGDENPMRAPECWRRELAERIRIPFWTVDADVVVPSRLFPTAQYAAYTFRPKLRKLLPEYLKPFDNLKADRAWKQPRGFEQDDVRADITRGWKDLDRSVGPVEFWEGGNRAATARLKTFVETILPQYDATRNLPEIDGSSRLSPYLHYGHIGPLTIALAVEEAVRSNPHLAESRDNFFNELITWRELCINFVRHDPNYDNVDCAADWAKKTIADHADDKREQLYTLEELEGAQTYDDLWNAAQIQMVEFGWMHNHLRMYWAKKILEWTPDARTAMQYTIYLNDRYFLDGRDPGGYAGVAWAIVGKFDRPWGERPVFGKRRYMSRASTGRKFDSRRYIAEMRELQAGGAPVEVPAAAER